MDNRLCYVTPAVRQTQQKGKSATQQAQQEDTKQSKKTSTAAQQAQEDMRSNKISKALPIVMQFSWQGMRA